MDGLMTPTQGLVTPQSVATGTLPPQDQYRAQILVDRWVRDAGALQRWSPTAKRCVDFVEGRQWSTDDQKLHKKLSRPMITINKVNRLLRLVYGYYSGNKTDITYAPSDDSISTEQVATVLSKLYHQETARNFTGFEDALVFLDGMTTGRGFWDIRMEYERNDLGETVGRALDPFSVYLQSDASDYDIQKHTRVSTSRWASVDEIAAVYGEAAADAVMAIVDGSGWRQFPQNYYYDVASETTPERRFDGEGERNDTWFAERVTNIVDPHLKNVRVLDIQHKVRTRAACFVDLETGDWKMIPESWDQDRIGKVLYHAEKMRNPIRVVPRVINRHRWTTLVGDIMLWDDWSPYDWFTIVPFFPYFRRGQTRGMLDDLLDPQVEINKKRSLRVEILGRTANGGFIYHEDSLDPTQEQALAEWGSTPGFRLKWRGDEPWKKPDRLDSQPRNLEAQTQEQDSTGDLHEISGVNESAAGDLDRVQSGKAILARQRQAVVGARLYFDNYSHSCNLKGNVYLRNFQNFYTEERIIREVGESGSIGTMMINQKVLAGDGVTVIDRLNDITLGRYSVVVKEVSHADTFEATQFEEMLTLFEALGDVGKQVAMTNPGLIVEMSNLPRKGEWKEALTAAVGLQEQQQQKAIIQDAILKSGVTNSPNQVSGAGRVVPKQEGSPPNGQTP